jgi:hypothetical protein
MIEDTSRFLHMLIETNHAFAVVIQTYLKSEGQNVNKKHKKYDGGERKTKFMCLKLLVQYHM